MTRDDTRNIAMRPGSARLKPKSEIRIPKFETNPNFPTREPETGKRRTRDRSDARAKSPSRQEWCNRCRASFWRRLRFSPVTRRPPTMRGSSPASVPTKAWRRRSRSCADQLYIVSTRPEIYAIRTSEFSGKCPNSRGAHGVRALPCDSSP